jgi:hypothetical protein
MQGWRCKRREDVHRRARNRIGHSREVDQRLDRAVTDLSPHPLVFQPRLPLRRVRRPRVADVAQIVEGRLDGAIAPIRSYEELHPQPGDGGQIGKSSGTASQFGQARLRFRQCAGQELALGAVEL